MNTIRRATPAVQPTMVLVVQPTMVLVALATMARVSGDGVESNRPETNFPEISVDSNRIDCLVEESGLGVAPRRIENPIKQGVFWYIGV